MNQTLSDAQRELLEMLEFAQSFALENNIRMFSGVVIGEDEDNLKLLIQDPHGTLSNREFAEDPLEDLSGKGRVGNA